MKPERVILDFTTDEKLLHEMVSLVRYGLDHPDSNLIGVVIDRREYSLRKRGKSWRIRQEGIRIQ